MAKTYGEKLKSPKWQKRRLEVLSKADWKCELCSDDETELHVHHLEYTGEPWEAPDSALQCLCKDCHLMVTKYIVDMHLADKVKKVRMNTFTGFVMFYNKSTSIASLYDDGAFHYISFSAKSGILKDMYLHNQSLD